MHGRYPTGNESQKVGNFRYQRFLLGLFIFTIVNIKKGPVIDLSAISGSKST